GLIYYRARWYDPSIGRFTQRDPSGLAGGLNPYAYVDGDPINNIDPSGLLSAKVSPVRSAAPFTTSGPVMAAGGQSLRANSSVAVARPIGSSTPTGALMAGSTGVLGGGISTSGLGAIGSALAGGAAIGSILSIPGDTSNSQQKTYATYTRVHPVTGQVYAGRTSGYKDPATLVRDRGLQQTHLNSEGFAFPVLDVSTTDYAAIRGREQQLIDFYGGAQTVGGTARNAINAIRDLNPNRYWYMSAAIAKFGVMQDNSPPRFRFGP
uniref:RHS repeat-associated core domain-containing protein n=1 Tax=Chitinivorax sp. B TaxID=2502235 RepID=UPI0010F7B51C